MAIRTKNEYLRQIQEQYPILSEFIDYKVSHKFAILKVKLIRYYRDLEAGSPTIPDFMREKDTPEAKADRDVSDLFANDREKFNSLYETAYQELAEVLE